MLSKVGFSLLSVFVAGSLLAPAGCSSSGSDGAAGAPGPTGATGSSGTDGTSGTSGTPFIKVTPAQLGSWKLLGANTATAAIVSERAWPVSSLGGTGSLRLSTGSGSGVGGDWPAWAGSGGKAFVGTTVLNSLALTELTALSYNAYNVSSGTVGLMPYLSVFVDLDGDGIFDKAKDDILAFDPSYFPATAQDSVAGDRWQNWDALSGTAKSWRCIFGKAKISATGTACTINTAYGWSELASNNPSAKVVPASCQEVPFPAASVQNTCATSDPTAPGLLFVAGQKSGASWAGYTGYLDDIHLGVQGFDQTYNFELQ